MVAKMVNLIFYSSLLQNFGVGWSCDFDLLSGNQNIKTKGWKLLDLSKNHTEIPKIQKIMKNPKKS
jgi:hypothetical protein